MDRTVVTIGVLTLLVFGGIIGNAVYQQKNFKPYNMCVEHSASLGMHIHPELQIMVNDKPEPIPANIGITPTCMKAVHTHDETGKLHLEYPEEHEFILGDFFAVWGKSLNKDQVLDHKVDETHVLTMTVDGQPSTEFENLALKDGQKIVISYTEKK